MEKRTLVLIVDDEERNLRLLESILVPQGYDIVIAQDGKEALEKSKTPALDAILLDIMMPVMDGFEVCRRLKADATTAPIPVLLVTSLDSRADRLRGIEAGATDFISKPIDKEYLMLKLKNAVYAKSLFNVLQSHYEKQRELEQVRDKLTNLIVQDMRTPLFGISGNLELLKMDCAALLTADQARYIDSANYSVRNMLQQVHGILAVNKFQPCSMEIQVNQDSLKEIALDAIAQLGSLRSKCNILVSCSPQPGSFSCDHDLVHRVVLNLLSNAVKFTASGDNIAIKIDGEKEGIRVRVEDAGTEIPEEFEKYGEVDRKTERAMYSAGLGLAFCRMAVEAHGGEIGVDSQEGRGGTFWFFLPNKAS